MEVIIETLSAFLTPMVAVATIVILILQYALAKRHWRTVLYDKRYPIYLATMEYLSYIAVNNNITDQELHKFLRKTRDKELLFGKDVQDYLSKLYNKGAYFKLLKFKLDKSKDVVGDDKWKELVDRDSDMLKWFMEQSKVSKELFQKYIRIDKK